MTWRRPRHLLAVAAFATFGAALQRRRGRACVEGAGATDGPLETFS